MGDKFLPEGVVRAEDVPPYHVILWGYNLLLADRATEGSHLRNSADKAVREFEDIADVFKDITPAGLYFVELRMVANRLAKGIARRQEIRDEQIREARQRKNEVKEDLVRSEAFSGLRRGGLRLLLLGGFASALVAFILSFSFPGLEKHLSVEKSPTYASLATGLGVFVIASFWKAYWIRRKMDRIGPQHDHTIARIVKEYTKAADMEYRIALERATAAWKRFTGREPPNNTAAFTNFVSGILGDDEPLEEEKTFVFHGGKGYRTLMKFLERIRDRIDVVLKKSDQEGNPHA